MSTARDWIKRLELKPHPEGGHYRETYRAGVTVPALFLGETRKGPRPLATSIYFLLEHPGFAALHRLASDELWLFHAGQPLLIHAIHPAGAYACLRLGADENGALPQVLVPAGCWFGAELEEPDSYALAGCVVAPGFDFADFELADRAALTRQYPEHRDLIERLTR